MFLWESTILPRQVEMTETLSDHEILSYNKTLSVISYNNPI